MLKRSLMNWLLGLAMAMGGVNSARTSNAEIVTVDPRIGSYEKVSGISGNLSGIGSDTLVNLMTLWREAFGRQYPGANMTIEGKGSSTAPPALFAGTAQLGPMSREMKSEEIDPFIQKYGFAPTRIGVALDALSVYVNKDNPIEKLCFSQVDAIFSKTRKRGSPRDITTWGQLGLAGEWANKPISLYGRNSASGTYGFFKEHVLNKGDYKETVKEQPGSAAVVQGVTADLAGIGYSGIGYTTSGVKAVPLAEKDAERGAAFEPNYANVLNKKYPLGRMLSIYVIKVPGKPLDPMVREFLKFVLSIEGQEIVVKDGYLPLPLAVVTKQLEILNK